MGNEVVKVSNMGVGIFTVSEAGPQSIAIDGAGNAWTASLSDTAVIGLSTSGSAISGQFGYTSGLSDPIEAGFGRYLGVKYWIGFD
jgi:hypothetical protein